jgi:hypothetical protein
VPELWTFDITVVKMKTPPKIIVILSLALCYPILYFAARGSHLLVRTPEAINADGLPSRYSNRIIPCRGAFPIQIAGIAGWYLFYPAHMAETWYRNRPEYFFRNSMSNQSAAANRRGRRPFHRSGFTTPTLRSTVAVPAVAELGRSPKDENDHR